MGDDETERFIIFIFEHKSKSEDREQEMEAMQAMMVTIGKSSRVISIEAKCHPKRDGDGRR